MLTRGEAALFEQRMDRRAATGLADMRAARAVGKTNPSASISVMLATDAMQTQVTTDAAEVEIGKAAASITSSFRAMFEAASSADFGAGYVALRAQDGVSEAEAREELAKRAEGAAWRAKVEATARRAEDARIEKLVEAQVEKRLANLARALARRGAR